VGRGEEAAAGLLFRGERGQPESGCTEFAPKRAVTDFQRSAGGWGARWPEIWRSCCLLCIGLASQWLYLHFFVRPYPLLGYYGVPLLDLGKLTGWSHAAARDFAVAFLLLFALCYAAYAVSRARSSWQGLLIVLLFALLCGLALMLVYPITAADVFEYIAYARITVTHGANPHVFRPMDFLDDSFMWYSAWPHITSPYGPLWTYLSTVIGMLGGPSLLTYLLLFKGLALGAHLLNSGLIYCILGRLKPSYALGGTVLYAWNPLVLFESAAGAHNDGLVMLPVLLAIYLFVRGRYGLAIPVAALSCLVKMPTVIVLPLFIVGAWRALAGKRSRLRVIAVSVAATVGLVLVLHAPLWEGWKSLGWLSRESLFTSSFATLAVLTLQHWVQDVETVQDAVRSAALGLFCLFYAWQLLRLTGQTRRFLEGLFWTLFAFLCVAVLWFQPWYVVWIVALGAVVPSVGVGKLTMLFSYSATWNYLVYVFFVAWFFPYMVAGNSLGMNLTSVLLVFGPPLAYAAWQARSSWVSAVGDG
jgi:hypothetical protein